MVQHLEHRAAGLDHHVRRQALAQQVVARDRAVGEVDVGRVVDDASVDFLRHAHVEAAIAGLHVEGRNLAPLGRNHRHATVGVAEHQHGIRLFCGQNAVDRDDHFADGLRTAGTGRIQEMIRLADAEVIEKDLVQFVIVVLAGMDQHVLAILVQLGHHPRQADDLRPRADHGGNFHFFHVKPCWQSYRVARGRRSRSPRA